MNEWVTVAVLGKPRGNRGEITAHSLSDHPERFSQLTTVFLNLQEHKVEEAWFHQGVLVFKFAGVDSISEAENLPVLKSGFRFPSAPPRSGRVLSLRSGRLCGA